MSEKNTQAEAPSREAMGRLVHASITGMRYVIQRTEAAYPPSREPLTEQDALRIVGNVADIGLGLRIVRATERAHGISPSPSMVGREGE